ncbi:hypothetical protein [Streptomyces goshikiensis]|uniref:hypothetical protein n=1 Tax=Streptomyces goshikiensis TaxID=1942 RepID=UPI002E10B940|nr:hypothetical protein OG224_04100 [Streptomyces goshikiensis]
MWERVVQDGCWALWLVCACYLVVVYITSRGLIGAPRYRLFQARVHDCRARAAILAATISSASVDSADSADSVAKSAVLKAINERLDGFGVGGQVVWRLLPQRAVIAIPLSKLAAAWRALHHAETQLLRLEGPEEIALRSLTLRLRLASDPDPVNNSLGTQLAAHAGDAPAERALLIAATEELHRQEDEDFEREYEHQHIALWLALTGIAAVLLLGGLGGFLSPLIGVMRSQRRTSWGVLVLAPVGGALAAPGGLLLVRMLADPELNLLGQVFLHNSWGAPAQPISLAVALLFGFSGTLFSRSPPPVSSSPPPGGRRDRGHRAVPDRPPGPSSPSLRVEAGRAHRRTGGVPIPPKPAGGGRAGRRDRPGRGPDGAVIPGMAHTARNSAISNRPEALHVECGLGWSPLKTRPIGPGFALPRNLSLFA